MEAVSAAPVVGDWRAARCALQREVARVVTLLREVVHPDAPAVGRWVLADVAMHLSQVWLVVPGLARADLSRAYEVMPSLAAEHGSSLIGDLWELSSVTTTGVDSDPERDPGVLADRIEARAAEYLAECEERSAEEVRPWLVEGITVALPMLTCHLLNETIAHGYDIARASGRSWTVDPIHAAMVLEGFIIPVIAALPPRSLVDQQRASGVRACYDVRIRGGGRYYLVFDDGTLEVEEPSSRRVDCHLSVDPAAFFLLAWGRIGQWGAIGRGQLMAWGRRPWMGLRLRSFLRNP